MATSIYPTIDEPIRYLKTIVSTAPFWRRLALIELKNRFRRTSIGMLWILIQPFALTLLLSTILRVLFDQSFAEFSVYVYSGIIYWELFSASILIASGSLVGSTAFIKQQAMPIGIYPLKTYIALLVSNLVSLTGLFAWTLIVKPDYLSAAWLWLIPNHLLIACMILPFAVSASLIGARFRDFPQAVGLALQALWFLSPVFLDKSVFENDGIEHWDRFNPVANMLDLVRQPLIHGEPATVWSYGVVVATGVCAYISAYFVLRRMERHIVFYL